MVEKDGVLTTMKNTQLNNFVNSHSIETHPLEVAKKKTRILYYEVLDYFVGQCVNGDEYTNARLLQCCKMLIKNKSKVILTDKTRESTIRLILNNRSRPSMWRYRFWLMCDIALISADRNAIERAQEIMARYLSKRQYDELGELVHVFFSDDAIPQKLLFVEDLIFQFRKNRKFVKQPEKRILITANMSAGKSTLINALVGKPVARTAQESCTANLCYFFNKPFEDDAVHLFSSQINLKASNYDLMNAERKKSSYIASYFRTLIRPEVRVCFVDTPGVNSAINRNHGELTRKALADETFDKLVYVLNATRLGTEDELQYLKYVSECVPKNKVIFVLNKLDEFKSTEDSITTSIESVQKDLHNLGYEHPVICPLSAYFALLLKMKQNGESLNADELDVYDLYIKKYSKSAYDLSSYYDEVTAPIRSLEDELSMFAIKCGLYGLEHILYGGNNNEKSIY